MQNDKQKRARGSGSIFQNGSAVWWIKFSERGIAHRESSHSTDREVAEALLDLRLAEVTTDTYVPRANIRIDELYEDLLANYREKQNKSIRSVEDRWRLHLAPFFTRRRVTEITTDIVRRYTKTRTAEGAAPATLNRELAILKHAFRLGMKTTPAKVKMMPHIPMFEERNVRKGFLHDDQYDRLSAEAAKEGLWMRALLAVGYYFGFRKSELLGLSVYQIDLFERTITLDVGETKNDEGRVVGMPDDVFVLVSALMARKKPEEPVFTRENGKPIKDFRKTWNAICVRAGVGRYTCTDCASTMIGKNCKCGNVNRKYVGLIPHDLRRTAARNLRRLGLDEKVSMRVTGHKTHSVFERYNIVDQTDMMDVARRQNEKNRMRAEKKSQALDFPQGFGQSLGRISENSSQSDGAVDGRPLAATQPN